MCIRDRLALDNDDAGRAASVRLAEKLTAEGFAVKIINPAGGRKSDAAQDAQNGVGHPLNAKDWNEYLCSGGTREEVKEQIESAQIFNLAGKETSVSTSEKQFKIGKENGNHKFETDELCYRVSGVKDLFAVSLRVNMKVSLLRDEKAQPHYDSIDLYSARSRASFCMAVSKALEVESVTVGRDLICILEYLESERDKNISANVNEPSALTSEEKTLGLTLLKSPTMFEDILSDIDSLGYVGEELNKLLLYIAASSRKLDDPISVLILSESASGKSMLIDTVAKLMPEEDVVSATSLSEQALNYIDDLMHKFVTLGEIVHSEAVDHQIREILSGKELSRLVTVKDEKTGKMSAKLVKTPAIVSLVMSGTSYAINPENASRCFLINTDESREQTKRIHERQREKYTLHRYRTKKETVPEIIRRHKCAQRMLRKIAIMNPITAELDFPVTLMRTRRDHDRFIDLIACVCFLRQYQKEVMQADGIEYVECDVEDYDVAYNIMISGVLNSTMRDLPKSTIEFYELQREMLREMAKKKNLEVHEVSFTQRDVREYTGYGNTWVKKNMRALIDYEYVITEKGGREKSKGLYRIKGDDSIGALDFSMIPTPEKMRELLKK